MALSGLRKVDIAMFTFLKDNECSDGPLQYAVTKYSDEFSYDIMLVGLALAFTAGSLLSHIIALICLTPCRGVIANYCNCLSSLSEPPSFERKLTSMNDSIKNKY